jgi:ABC-type transport system involved in multi-copper enzyme maturation permease subunit
MLGPIFIREWLTTPRRPRHFVTRGLVLAALWVLLLTIYQTTVGWDRPPTLGDQARFGLLSFQVLIHVQLCLLLFFAALSAAGTISQEKDRRTFLLLLMTDLRNTEIVLGKVMGSLLQIGVFLVSAVPVFMILMLLGGVAPFQVGEAFLVLATTTLAAGSLGGLVALWRDKTFQSLALTVLLLVFFLCCTRGLSLLPRLFAVENATIAQIQERLDPFLALANVVDPPATETSFLQYPTYGFALVMLGMAFLLNLWGVAFLRVWNPSGEPIMQREGPETAAADAARETVDRAKAHAAPGAIRPVWDNPILWREIATRAYGRRPLLIKFAYGLVIALICYYTLGLIEQRSWAAARGLVPITVLSLLLISAQAVTAITSERDLGAFDLLMVTDLSPREFIFGKIGGILYNTKEYLIPPLVMVLVYAFRNQLSTPATLGRSLEAGLLMLLACMILMTFTVTLGLHVALRADTSRLAISHSLGTVFFLSVGTLLCIYLILINGRFEYQWLSFSAFIFLGVGGLWWVLCGDRPSAALTLASWLCPFAVFYTVTNILIGKPGGIESTDPKLPFIITAGSFGFAVAAMLVPLLSEFDVAIGRTSAGGD